MKRFSLSKSLLAAATALLAMGAQAQTQSLILDTNDFTCDGNCGTSGPDGDIGASPLSGTYGWISTEISSTFAVDVVGAQRPDGVLGNGTRAVSMDFVSDGNINAWFNFITTDSRDFGDYAWARLIDAETNLTASWLFTVRGSKQGTDNLIPGNLPFTVNTNNLVNLNSTPFNSRSAKDNQFVNWSPLGGANQTCFEDSKDGGCGFTGWLNSQVTVAPGNYRLEVGVVNFFDRGFDSGLAFDVATMTAPVPELGTAPMMLAAFGAFGFFARRRMNRGV
jgi:hypothetical protein